MADLQDFKIVRQAGPTFRVETRVTRSVSPFDTLADFTGAQSLMFPAVIATLSTADQDELMSMIGAWLVMKKAGLS